MNNLGINNPIKLEAKPCKIVDIEASEPNAIILNFWFFKESASQLCLFFTIGKILTPKVIRKAGPNKMPSCQFEV